MNLKHTKHLMAAGVMALASVTAGSSCTEDKNDNTALLLAAYLLSQNDLKISGDWKDNYDYEYSITNKEWETTKNPYGDPYTDEIVEFANNQKVVYTQKNSDDAYYSDKYQRTYWTQLTETSFYYCTDVFDAATLQDAKDATRKADASDPANSGCGDSDFAWTKATAK